MIALDFPSEERVFNFLSQFDEPLFVKVGLELYLQEGPSIIKKIKELGHEVFLDLKLVGMILAPTIAQLVYQNWKWPLEVIKDFYKEK